MNAPRAAANHPPDHAQRQRALDPRRSFIVQAPAGSGKTELLVRRYLSLLAEVEAPEQILAITFTNKATAEMRLRIVSALQSATTKNNAPDDPEMRAIADAALANAEKRDWRILDHTRRLRIQTIDAFCNELVRRMPWSARFGAPPDIVDDPSALYARAAKQTLDHIERDSDWSRACAQLLALVDADWNKAQTLLADMLEKRDKWMRMLGPADRAHLERMWSELAAAELRGAAAMIPPQQQMQLVQLGAFAAANLRTRDTESSLAALHDAREFPAADHSSLAEWRGLADLVLTQAGSVRKTVTVTQGFPAEHKTQKQEMLELLREFAAQPELAEALRKARLLPGAEFSDAQWHSIDALMRVLPLAAAELRLVFAGQNQADFIELTQRAEMALGDADNPSDLTLAFDCKLTHLLMDEFQDTSSAHIELLTRLTAGWQRDDGRTVFFVGDPMQSIYGFRQAEVANFLQVQQTGLGDILPESIVLESNFRSAPQLVDWFNRAFAQVLPARDDIVNNAVKYAPAAAHAKHGQSGAAQFHPGINRDRAHEADAIAALIEQAQQQDAAQSIAVLGRTRGHLSAVAGALRRRAIAFHAVDLEKLAERAAIRDLLALTRALAQPADRIAWLSLLRAPWCGLSLADLSVLGGADHWRALPESLRDPDLRAALSAPGRACLRRFADAVATALARSGRIGLRQNVEAAWLALGGPATVEQPDLDDCQRYFDLLSEMEAKRIEINADSLNAAIENLWARGGVDARVQLLSIHKAKGLEFDVVLVPGLERRTRGDDKALLRWRKLPEQLLLAPLPSSTERDDPFYRYLEHLAKVHEQNETGRLLYVACTRARKNLHLFGNTRAKGEPSRNDNVSPPGENSLLSMLWPLAREEFVAAAVEDAAAGNVAAEADANAAGDADEFPPQPVRRLPKDWSPPQLPASIQGAAADAVEGAAEEIEFSWAGETARVVGIVIHSILQRVDDVGWEIWRKPASEPAVEQSQKNSWRNQLIENGVGAEHLDAALAQVANAIAQTRRDPRAAWLFSRAHQHARAEWPLAGVVDGKVVHIVIDRSFTDENGVRWIVDFKSSRHQGAGLDVFLDRERERHQPQMSLYAAVLGQLQPGEIRLGLYFPALQGWREWSASEPPASYQTTSNTL